MSNNNKSGASPFERISELARELENEKRYGHKNPYGHLAQLGLDLSEKTNELLELAGELRELTKSALGDLSVPPAEYSDYADARILRQIASKCEVEGGHYLVPVQMVVDGIFQPKPVEVKREDTAAWER